MFTGLRSRLMLSFSALLLVCLVIFTVTFGLLFFLWVGLPELAHARLLDAAGPTATHVRALVQRGQQLPDVVVSLQAQARDRGMRVLMVVAPSGQIKADSEGQWVGERVYFAQPADRKNAPPANPLPRVQGKLRAPDRGLLYYVAVPVSTARADGGRGVYLALTMTPREAARPFLGSLLIGALLAGAVAFALSIMAAAWLARSLAGPLQRAAAAAERVASGDYTVSLSAASPDEARRLAESFNTMTRAVRAVQQSQRDFVANVSHELRTPLTSIQGFAQAILDGTAGDTALIRRSAAIIHDEADRLARMVSSLLDLARWESGEVSMARQQVDLTALLEGCLSRFDLLAAKKGVQLAFDAPDQVFIVGDGDRLTQVFTNLLDNALQYTARGGRVSVRIVSDQAARVASVVVRDNGAGIPQDDLPRIFERFYRVDKSRTRQSGTGLGLPIALEIVRAHGGQIDVQSEVGQGAQVTVALPVDAAREK